MFCDKALRIFLVFFLFLIENGSFAQVDILLKGGHVIDPKNKINEQMDVAIGNGKIIQVAKNISASDAKKVIDAKGLYVTPGIIDMHVHAFYGSDLDAYIANAQTSLPDPIRKTH